MVLLVQYGTIVLVIFDTLNIVDLSVATIYILLGVIILFILYNRLHHSNTC